MGSCSGKKQTVTLRYTGTAPTLGYDHDLFVGHSFELESIATLNSTEVRSSQPIGIHYVHYKP